MFGTAGGDCPGCVEPVLGSAWVPTYLYYRWRYTDIREVLLPLHIDASVVPSY